MRKPSTEQTSWLKTLGLVGNLGFQIAVPLVALAVLGRALDRRFETSPWLFLAGIFLSIIVTSLLIAHRVQQLLSTIERNNDPHPKP